MMATHSDIQDEVPIQESNAIVHACTQIDFNLVKARLHIYTSIYHDTLNFQQWKYMKIEILSMYGYMWREWLWNDVSEIIHLAVYFANEYFINIERIL